MTENLGLGRRASEPDPVRLQTYSLRAVTPERPAVTSRTWYTRGVLDQDGTSQCVAYSGWKYLQAAPVMNKPRETPEEIYRRCLEVDEWPGEDWDGGTSVAALFKVLSEKGYVGEYRWAYDLDTVIDHVLARGPVVMGTNWYRGMFTPHVETGYMELSGPNEGGHAWVLIGANRRRKNPDGTTGAARKLGSWGSGWGQRGRAWITFRDLERLIREQGEACCATEIKLTSLRSRSEVA